MDNHERQLLQSAIELLHQLIGYADAKEDFKPILRFVEDDPKVIPFPMNAKLPLARTQEVNFLPKQKSDVLGTSEAERGFVEFTEKEILQMPKEKRNYFRINGLRVHWRKKKNGVFELRCTINKVPYYGAAVDLRIAKKRFIEDLKRDPEKDVSEKKKQLPSLVGAYTLHYLENFKKPNTGKKTYENYLGIAKRHVIKKLGPDTPIKSVTATDCQTILKGLRDEGKGRTAEDVNNLFDWIFEAAISDGLISVSPMQAVKIPRHRRKPGKCIPIPIMKLLLADKPKSRYEYLMWFMAYTGMRPFEIQSSQFEADFVTIQNAKEDPNDEPTFRRIPIHSALSPYLSEIKANVKANAMEAARYFRKRMKALNVKGYRFYDLRHTFTTIIQENGANKEWVDYITNHVSAQNVTDRVYTHWNDTFHREQIEKLRF